MFKLQLQCCKTEQAENPCNGEAATAFFIGENDLNYASIIRVFAYQCSSHHQSFSLMLLALLCVFSLPCPFSN